MVTKKSQGRAQKALLREKGGGLAKAGRPKKIGGTSPPISRRTDPTPTLADMGIDKHLADEPLTRTSSWCDTAAAERDAAARVVAALLPVGTPAVDLARLERSITTLRNLGRDPIRILTEAADGETLFRQSVKSETHDDDVIRLLAAAESNDLPFRCPSMQDELFRARNRIGPETFSDEMGAVIAGRHPAVKTWKVAWGARGNIYRFKDMHEVAEEIKRIDGAMQWFEDEQDLLAWMKGCPPPPSWVVRFWGMERFAHILTHYRGQYGDQKGKPYLEMAAALMSAGEPACAVRLAKSELATRKKAADRAKGTKP
jgi:hypothetical protein